MRRRENGRHMRHLFVPPHPPLCSAAEPAVIPYTRCDTHTHFLWLDEARHLTRHIQRLALVGERVGWGGREPVGWTGVSVCRVRACGLACKKRARLPVLSLATLRRTSHRGSSSSRPSPAWPRRLRRTRRPTSHTAALKVDRKPSARSTIATTKARRTAELRWERAAGEGMGQCDQRPCFALLK